MEGQRSPELLALAYRLQERTKRKLSKLLKPGGIKLLYAAEPDQIRRMADKASTIFVEASEEDPIARSVVRSILGQSVHHSVLMVTPAPLPLVVREHAVAHGVHDFVALTADSADICEQVRLAAARSAWSRSVLEVLSHRVQKHGGVRRAEFAAKLAHDLANLLQVVDAELAMTAHAIDGELPTRLDDALTASATMGTLIGKLRAMGGGRSPEPVILDVHEMIHHFRALVHGAVSDKVTVDVACDVEGRLFLPPGDLDQILLNLASNASEAMPDGGRVSLVIDRVRLRTDPGEVAQVRSFMRFSFTDTGRGIAQDMVNHLFEPRAVASGEVGRVGRGLGLSIVGTIVDRADGRVFVSSDLGRGSKFQILLPEARDAEMGAGDHEAAG